MDKKFEPVNLETLGLDLERLGVVMRPQGASPVARSPFFSYIIESGLRGIAPIRIYDELQAKAGGQGVPSPDDIAAYFAEFVPADLRIPYFQLQKYRDPSYPISPIETMLDLLALQRSRVGEAVVRDIGVDNESLRREIDLCGRLCKQLMDFGQAAMFMGKNPEPPRSVTPYVEKLASASLPLEASTGTLDLTDVTAEEANNVLAALAKLMSDKND